MKKIVGIFLVISLIFVSACSKQKVNEGNDDSKIIVTTTIGQIADAVKHIGGEKVAVKSLMGPGTDPHLYKATQGDIAKLEKADIIFYSGLHLEGKMLDVLERINKTKPTYAIAEAIDKESLLSANGGSYAYDPHVWFDINLWKQALEEVKTGLIEIDPDNEAYYEENAQNYFKQLNELHAYAAEEMARIPEEQRVLVTAHDAFGYFGKAFDMEVMGLQGLSTDSEYGLGDVQKLVDTLVKRNIKAVFIESSISERSINAVIEGAKKKGHKVKIGGELYSDAMGKEGTDEGTYIGMYKHNVKTISESIK
ncbi:metal ABC transporter solute-binding protein, Zn/Mn family [Cytobacillus solani]|uniref:metal ABC transporter solute-binding protein, Zn/Mn family n=1 Tax=Cytobacillus solani TaxID=1637975 RepID=UPI0006ABAFE4|nr:zinc ABC transporter substrate-binding protein [Cytobacillus solani]KOP83157.1 manganese transporter [Bacillus sp. FJAT-21945]USK53435.1 zinc ABC transporter substrate-binding protein [Cytobacillus solani]